MADFKSEAGQRRAKIAGLGEYLPDRVVTNEELEARCGMTPGWIRKRTGVETRHWVADGETNSSMAAQASQAALAQASIQASDFDLVINASGTTEQIIPDGGPFLLRALDFDEPESATLMGDGAAAAVVTPSHDVSVVGALHLETFPDGLEYAQVRTGSTLNPRDPTWSNADTLFHMEGKAILRALLPQLMPFIERSRPGLSAGLGDIDWVVPHQMSRVGLRTFDLLHWPADQVIANLDQVGNCVAASMPIALCQGVASGRIKRGDKGCLRAAAPAHRWAS